MDCRTGGHFKIHVNILKNIEISIKINFYLAINRHNEAVQAIAFNPVTHVLLSCAVTDFGLWSNDQKSVPKTKVNSRITCCSWTLDGQFMALGFFSGLVQIRDKSGAEKIKIERPDAANSPIWSLEWSPNRY